MQVTIGARALIVDLKMQHELREKKVKDKGCCVIRDFSDMQQLIDPDKFVCSEVHVRHCTTDDELAADLTYRFTKYISVNKSKDFFFVG